MSLAPSRLYDVRNVGDPVSVVQQNFEILAEDLYKFTPTYQSGVVTTIIGPPTSGDRVVDEVWRDALLGIWRCTIAGNPGTWRQEKPAVVALPPSTGTIPTGYAILDYSDRYRLKFHLGSYVWGHGISARSVAKNSAYSATSDDYLILCTTTSAGFTLTLPTPSTVAGHIFAIKKVSSDGNTLTLSPASGTIDGSASKTTTTQYAGWVVQSDGTNYHILNNIP